MADPNDPNDENRGYGPLGQVFIDNEGCYRLRLSERFLVRTLDAGLSRAKTHVTLYRAAYEKKVKWGRGFRTRFIASADAYLEAPVTVELLRGLAPGHIILDSLLEAVAAASNIPAWVERRLEKLAAKGLE